MNICSACQSIFLHFSPIFNYHQIKNIYQKFYFPVLICEQKPANFDSYFFECTLTWSSQYNLHVISRQRHNPYIRLMFCVKCGINEVSSELEYSCPHNFSQTKKNRLSFLLAVYLCKIYNSNIFLTFRPQRRLHLLRSIRIV